MLQAARLQGITRRPGQRCSSLYKLGITRAEIAERFRVSLSWVGWFLKRSGQSTKREKLSAVDFAEILRLRLMDPNLSQVELARRFNVSQATIGLILRENGIRQSTSDDAKKAEIIRLHEVEHLTNREIAAREGASKSTVQYFLQKTLGTSRKVLFAADQKEIVRLYKEVNLTQQMIGARLGFSQTAIGRALSRHSIKCRKGKMKKPERKEAVRPLEGARCTIGRINAFALR